MLLKMFILLTVMICDNLLSATTTTGTSDHHQHQFMRQDKQITSDYTNILAAKVLYNYKCQLCLEGNAVKMGAFTPIISNLRKKTYA